MDSAGISKTAFTSEDCNISLLLLYSDVLNGAVAHLVERQVRNLKVASSSLVGSNNFYPKSLSIDNSSRYDTTLLVTIASFGDGKGLFLTLKSTTFSLSLRLIYNSLVIIFRILSAR